MINIWIINETAKLVGDKKTLLFMGEKYVIKDR